MRMHETAVFLLPVWNLTAGRDRHDNFVDTGEPYEQTNTRFAQMDVK